VDVWKALLMINSLKIMKFFAIFYIAFYSINTSSTAISTAINSKASTSNSSTSTWLGTVIHVTDGDTLRVRPLGSNSKSDSVRIRIDGIDAPESCQRYGLQSTLALKKLVLSKQITVVNKRFDDYGRDVAKITLDGVDIGAWMVKHGHAWSYHYKFSDGPYGVEEKTAIKEKLGLFADASAVNPKIFRREHGSCFSTKSSASKKQAQ
jgi:endonuclease YncB( thermonuclease family)